MMTTRRFVGTCAAAFLASQILAIAIHGFILRADYEPFYGTLLRSTPAGFEPRMLLLPVSHLCFIIALVWMFNRLPASDSPLRDGLRLGVIGWLIGQAPMWLLWYAEQPWPDGLVLKQLGLELVAALIVGTVVATVARRTPTTVPQTRQALHRRNARRSAIDQNARSGILDRCSERT
jgi:hypothetical protein